MQPVNDTQFRNILNIRHKRTDHRKRVREPSRIFRENPPGFFGHVCHPGETRVNSVAKQQATEEPDRHWDMIVKSCTIVKTPVIGV